MSRWLMQCLTVVTMLASVVHAQCLLACSTQLPAQASAVLSDDSGEHSCCPHQSDRKSQNSEKPCRPDSSAINLPTDEISAAASVVLPVALLDQSGGALLPVLAFQTRHTPDASPDSSTLSLLSSISILRI
jgi:hypothetical protein